MKKFIIFICSFTVILSSLVFPVSAQNYLDDLQRDKGDKTVKLNCKIDYMISLDDDSVIIEKNADMPASPASLTKIMTALIVLQNVKDLNKTAVVSHEAIESLVGTGSSNAGLKEGEELSIYDLLCCLLIPSGSDAASALARTVAGSEEKFVAMMNETANKLGCTNTHFDNAHGLDTETQKTTARDIVKITRAALEYPAFKTIVACNTYTLPATNMHDERQIVSTNFLISPYRKTYYNKYCKGIKTGSTSIAGKCLVSYASKGGCEYLVVAMGGEQIDTDHDGITENQAFMDSNKMYDWAFSNLKFEVITQEGQFICSSPIKYNWKSDSVRLVAESEVLALVPQGNDSESVSFEPVDLPETLEAPISKGDPVCKAKIMYAGQQIGTAQLVSADDIHLNVSLFMITKLREMTKTKLFIAIVIILAVLVLAYAGLYIRANRIRKKRRQIKMIKYNELERNTQKRKK